MEGINNGTQVTPDVTTVTTPEGIPQATEGQTGEGQVLDQTAANGEGGAQAQSKPADIGALFTSAGASTGDGSNLLDNFLPDYDFDGNKEVFEGFVDSDTGENYANFLKSEAFKSGAKTKEEMDLFVKGAMALANNINLFNDEPLETRIQKSLLSYPKERQGNLTGIWNRATGTLDEDEMKAFQEDIATDPKLLLIIDKMIGNGVKLNKVFAGATKSNGSAKYTIEQYREDIRKPEYYSDPNFAAKVNKKAREAGL